MDSKKSSDCIDFTITRSNLSKKCTNRLENEKLNIR